MEIQFLQADQLDFDPRPQMGEIFAEGFAHLLASISKDTALLAKAFAHVFDLEHFTVAVQGNKVLAMTACTNGISPIRFDKYICRKELGFLRGSIAYAQLTKYIVNHKFPFDFHSNMGRIEIVGTASEYQGKGIAYRLIKHIMDTTSYTEYVLEVLDDNPGAIRLYEKLGFETFQSIKSAIVQKGKRTSFLYMKHVSE